jgi:hypothetical protein
MFALDLSCARYMLASMSVIRDGPAWRGVPIFETERQQSSGWPGLAVSEQFKVNYLTGWEQQRYRDEYVACL